MKFINLEGKKFGKLTVGKSIGNEGGYRVWNCICSCGKSKDVQSRSLVSGIVKSCGCLFRTVNGLSNTGAYKTWLQIRNKCINKDHVMYKNYGAKGIILCKSWHDFLNFYNDMGDRPKGLVLDRENPKKGFNKSNCNWVNPKDQHIEGRTRLITFNGKTKTLSGWATKLGIGKATLQYRLDYAKMSLHRALTAKTYKQRKEASLKG